MSKKKKKEMTTIIALVVVLAVVCVGYFVLVKHNDAKDKAADTSVNLLQLDSSSATKLDITNDNGNFSFEKSGDTWTLSGDAEFTVNQSTIQTIIDGYADLTASKQVVDNKDSLSEYGLDKPAAVGTLTLDDGTTVTLSLGSTVPVNGGYYGMLDSSDGVYTFDETTFANLFSAQDTFKAEESTDTSVEDATAGAADVTTSAVVTE